MNAIMADEARDGKTELLGLCVRYVSQGAVRERLLSLTELTHFDAVSISTAIEDQLVAHGIEDLKCVAQTYDGASCNERASGGCTGPFRQKAPRCCVCLLFCTQTKLSFLSHM